jgi:hypothetical protein
MALVSVDTGVHHSFPLSLFLAFTGAHLIAADLSVSSYPSLQDALTANPGKQIFVPAGDYVIQEKLRIRGDRAGLFGPGRIIQERSDQPILEIENAEGVEIRDLTLTRPDGNQDTRSEAILAIKCRDLVIDKVIVGVQIHVEHPSRGNRHCWNCDYLMDEIHIYEVCSHRDDETTISYQTFGKDFIKPSKFWRVDGV